MLNIYPPGSWRENTWTVVLTQYYVFNTGHQTVTPTGMLCLIFGNIAILSNSSTLISKITVAKLKLVLRWSFGAFPYDITVQIPSFLSFPDFDLIDPEMVSKSSTYILKTIQRIYKTLFLRISRRCMTIHHTL